MKELAAFILLVVVVIVGWNQPFARHWESIAPTLGFAPAAVAKPTSPVPVTPLPSTPPPRLAMAAATPAPVRTPDSSWRFAPSQMDVPVKTKKHQ